LALYYLGKNETSVQEREDEIVVVSPSLYWYGHAKFPTRSLGKARRLADAFLDARPPSYTTIHVEKRAGGYDCYAYDAQELTHKIVEAGAQKAPAWFLQQLRSQTPLRIKEGLVAESINDVVVEIPDERRSLPTLASIDVPRVAKPFLRPAGEGSTKGLFYAVAGLLAVVMVLDLGLRLQKYSAIRHAYDTLGGARSLYEIQALVKRYEKEAAAQERLRAELAKALEKNGLKRVVCSPKGCRSE